MAIQTLNQILQQIEAFANAHYQIKSYWFQNIWELNTSGVVNYPAMVVYTRQPVRRWVETQHGLDIYIIDRLKTDRSNEQEILSDTTSIAEDLIAYLRHPTLQQEGLLIRDSMEQTLDYLSESKPDNVAGVVIPLDVVLKKPDDRCSIPATGLVPSTGVGSQVTIYNISSGSTITTVPCGGSYGVTVFDGITDDPDLNTTTIIDPL